MNKYNVDDDDDDETENNRSNIITVVTRINRLFNHINGLCKRVIHTKNSKGQDKTLCTHQTTVLSLFNRPQQ